MALDRAAIALRVEQVRNELTALPDSTSHLDRDSAG